MGKELVLLFFLSPAASFAELPEFWLSWCERFQLNLAGVLYLPTIRRGEKENLTGQSSFALLLHILFTLHVLHSSSHLLQHFHKQLQKRHAYIVFYDKQLKLLLYFKGQTAVNDSIHVNKHINSKSTAQQQQKRHRRGRQRSRAPV